MEGGKGKENNPFLEAFPSSLAVVFLASLLYVPPYDQNAWNSLLSMQNGNGNFWFAFDVLNVQNYSRRVVREIRNRALYK